MDEREKAEKADGELTRSKSLENGLDNLHVEDPAPSASNSDLPDSHDDRDGQSRV